MFLLAEREFIRKYFVSNYTSHIGLNEERDHKRFADQFDKNEQLISSNDDHRDTLLKISF